jgi:hypothetical protein
MNRREFLTAAGITAALVALGVKVTPVAKPLVTGVGRGSPRIFDNFGLTIGVPLDQIHGDTLTLEVDEDIERQCIQPGDIRATDANGGGWVMAMTFDSDRFWRDAVRIRDGNGDLWRTFDQGETWVRAPGDGSL